MAWCQCIVIVIGGARPIPDGPARIKWNLNENKVKLELKSWIFSFKSSRKYRLWMESISFRYERGVGCNWCRDCALSNQLYRWHVDSPWWGRVTFKDTRVILCDKGVISLLPHISISLEYYVFPSCEVIITYNMYFRMICLIQWYVLYLLLGYLVTMFS